MILSHAHEGEIPGTVDLSAVEGDDTAYGQALYPVPAEDPNDPLQVCSSIGNAPSATRTDAIWKRSGLSGKRTPYSSLSHFTLFSETAP
jgi:hypothetical protein